MIEREASELESSSSATTEKDSDIASPSGFVDAGPEPWAGSHFFEQRGLLAQEVVRAWGDRMRTLVVGVGALGGLVAARLLAAESSMMKRITT